MRGRWTWLLVGAGGLAVLMAIGVVALAVIAWASLDFGDDFDPPPDPTDREIAALREAHGDEMYWLGRTYRGKEIRHADFGELSYGEDYCDSFDQVCSYEIDVDTFRARSTETEDPDTGERFPICWRRIGRALALGCDDGLDPSELEVFTGSVRVYVASETGPALPIARALRPMKGGTLEAPKPFTCREMRELSKRLRRSLPGELRGCRRT